MKALAGASTLYEPRRIAEPEMPIEMQDGSGQQAAQEGKAGSLKGLDVPSVVVYRLLVALSRTGNVKGAYRLLKEKGWVTSDTTLYGNRSKPSLLARAGNGGYISADLKLTEKGLDVIDPARLIAGQGIYAGNEEHKELMRKTIEMVQDRSCFAFVPKEKGGFDVGELRATTRSSWNFGSATAYECQTNAIREEIEKCIARANGTGVTFVVPSEELKERIAEIGGREHKVVVIE